MNLAQLQSQLFSLVTADGKAKSKPAELVNGGDLTPETRVGIYAEMYLLRTRDALREDFEKVAARLGEDFEPTVDAYIQAHHSEHYSLGMLGRSFANFLRAQPEKAVVADLAELEWAHANAFLAADTEVLTPQALAGLNPAEFAAGKLQLVPSLRILHLTHDIRELWRSGGEVPATPTILLVWRKAWEVFHVAIAEDEARALEALLAGGTIEAACEAFAQRDDPATAAFTAIASWFTEGMVASLNP